MGDVLNYVDMEKQKMDVFFIKVFRIVRGFFLKGCICIKCRQCDILVLYIILVDIECV